MKRRQVSIGRKLTLMILVFCIAALIIEGIAYIGYDVDTMKDRIMSDFHALSLIMGKNSAAAIEFNDEQTAAEVLSSLKLQAHIVRAYLLRQDGSMIASYHRDNSAPESERLIKTEGEEYKNNQFVFLKNIYRNNKYLGALYLEADSEEVYTHLRYNLLVMFVLIIVISIVIFWAASILQNLISGPILELVKVAKTVTETKNYSVDLPKYTGGEIGQLFDSFGQMMQLIHSRDAELNDAKNELEQRVQARTAELQKAYDDLKGAQTQLVQSEKMASIGQLAAGVAHEINNPVGFISNNMELLEQYTVDFIKVLHSYADLKKSIGQGDDERSKAIVKEIERIEAELQLDFIITDTKKLLQHNLIGLERVRKIVLDLKTFAHEGSDAMDLAKVEDIIDSTISVVHNELKYKAELVRHYGQTPQVNCSPQRLGQVFINLLVNAAQAIEERGTITIRTYLLDNYVCVEIQDTGKGIKEEHMKRMFEPFFTTKPVGKGTGLGLSVSYE